MKLTLYNYWQFLKKPRLLKMSKDKNELVKDLVWLFVLDYLFAALVIGVHGIFLHYKLVKEYENFDFFKEFGFWLSLLFAGVAAPLIEESIFRWQLTKRLLSIYFVFISVGLVAASFVPNDHFKFIIFIVSIVVAIVIHLMISRLNGRAALKTWRKYYIYIFYFTAIIFGYVHYTNIKGLTPSDPVIIFYILSQIFTGLSLGYLRVKYGLKYAILFHACFNIIAITLAWLLK